MKKFISALAQALVVIIIITMSGARAENFKEDKNAKYAMVVLSDLHVTDKIYDAEKKVIDTVNGWRGVDSVAVLGDICNDTGSDESFRLAEKLLKELKPVKYCITGNHDYLYGEKKIVLFKKKRAPEQVKIEKLNRFKKAFGRDPIYYSIKEAGYLLVFLSADELNGKYLVTISDRQIEWLKDTLSKNKTLPTIIFAHAPLKGSYTILSTVMTKNNSSLQPADTIDEILKKNGQVFMWVAGHLHISASMPEFDSAVNTVDGRVTVIHNSRLSGGHNRLNVLILSPGYVTVRTFDCKSKTWLEKYERKIYCAKKSENVSK